MGKRVGYTLDKGLILHPDEGFQGAGTLFYRESLWNAATFPK